MGCVTCVVDHKRKRKYQGYNWDKIYQNINSDDEECKKSARTDACASLKGYILTLASRKYPTYLSKECGDLMQQCYTTIIEELPNYNPEKGAPTTFFSPYLEHTMLDWMRVNVASFSVYYSTCLNKCKGYFKEHPEWTDQQVAEAVGISHVTVKKVREQLAASEKFSLDERFENETSSRFNEVLSVEEEIEKKEEKEILNKWIDNLLGSNEKEVIYDLYGFGNRECLTIAQASEKYKLSKRELEELKTTVLTKLRESPLISELSGGVFR